MKSKLGLIVTLLMALMLITYSSYLSAQPDISQAWKGSASSRTWVVFEFIGEEPSEYHFEIGDTFRIQGARNHMQFVPLGLLRNRWNRPVGSDIALDRKAPNKHRLCGKFDLDNHPDLDNDPATPHRQHFIVVEADPDDENKIFIDIKDNVDFDCANPTHGGRVHAEN